ncbi:MAG: alpha/beta hydrolase [Anaerolineales bacterium]|nr:alpha/beta hydrolase [Anaerolineales bacterium]
MLENPVNPAGLIYFNHGRDSGPWATKIARLANVARDKGFSVESLDYTGILDADRRVQILLDSARTDIRPLILVGSSMGGYVASVASAKLHPQGLFLMAPAFYMREFAVKDPSPIAETIFIIHGWRDEVIPVDDSIRFARKYRANLHLLDGDHRLIDRLPTIAELFGLFLEQLKSTSGKGQM